ncbi:slipin family protein [Saccharopolyspora sp. ID03-671]|uniref:slipin family protein n=1 Tax=Saccharopolyspora sp. ID03-671 TaxID=3073066 RepID=UPI00324B0A43
MLIELLIAILVLGVVYVASSVKIIKQYERGVVFRFGRLQELTRGPGITTIVPAVDHLRKVNLQIVTMPVPAQEGITRDNVTVRVDAVVYFRVQDAARAVVNVEDYLFAMGQLAQTSLRSIIGKSDLDDLLSNRERLNQGLEIMIDSPALEWGVHIDRVEIKDVSLPESMKRSIARQAEAERERRSRVISADGEFQASRKLSDAARVMSDTPAALQLRLLETVVEVAAEKNSTLVLPFPVELLRFVDTIQQTTANGEPAEESRKPEEPQEPEAPELTEAERRAAELPEETTPAPALPQQRVTEEPADTEVLGTA